MDNPIEITHYTSFAIDDLLFLGKQWKAARLQSARQIGSLVDLMRRGVKFLLPNCAELIDEKSIGEAHLELLRLPYPVTIFEAPWELDRPVDPWLNGAPQSRSSRRIALCWELSEDIVPFAGLNTRYRQMFPEGGVFIFPVYYLDALRNWSPGVGGLFVPHDSRVDGHLADTPATTLAHHALRSAGRLKGKGYRFRAEPFALIPDLFAETVARFNGDEALAFSQVIVDAHDEVGMVVQACTVLKLHECPDRRCAARQGQQCGSHGEKPDTVLHVQGAPAKGRGAGRSPGRRNACQSPCPSAPGPYPATPG